MPSIGQSTNQASNVSWQDALGLTGSSNQSQQSAGSDSRSSQSAFSEQNAESGSAWSKEQLARIAALYPQLLSEYTGLNKPTSFESLLSTVGGPPTPFNELSPFQSITVGPIWGENQIQGRVNQMRAGNDASTIGETRRLAESTAGRGFGANSPLYQELAGNLMGQNLATNTQGENDLRWKSAEGNAAHRLATEQAGVGRSVALNAADLARSQAISNDDLQRRQMSLGARGQDLQFQVNRQNELLKALGYYNQPLPFSKSSGKSGSSASSTSKSYSQGSSSGDSFGYNRSTGGSRGSSSGQASNRSWEDF